MNVYSFVQKTLPDYRKTYLLQLEELVIDQLDKELFETANKYFKMKVWPEIVDKNKYAPAKIIACVFVLRCQLEVFTKNTYSKVLMKRHKIK